MEKITSGRGVVVIFLQGVESLDLLLQDIYKKEISKLEEGEEILKPDPEPLPARGIIE